LVKRALRSTGISLSELRAIARRQGFAHLGDVHTAILETNGVRDHVSRRTSHSSITRPNRAVCASVSAGARAAECALAADQNGPRWRPVRANQLERKADQLVGAGLDTAQVEPLDADDAGAEQHAVRLGISDREVVDAQQLDAALNQ